VAVVGTAHPRRAPGRADGTTRLVFEESLSGVGVSLLYSRRRLRRQHEVWLSAEAR
jgi:hypothetical protein